MREPRGFLGVLRLRMSRARELLRRERLRAAILPRGRSLWGKVRNDM